jgi:phytoene dehydrogenase-like protein
VAIVRLALERPPRFAGHDAGETIAGRIQIGSTLDELERAYDASKYGAISERPYLELTVPSIADPSLAPAGGAVLVAWVQFVPYAASAASPETARREVERRVLTRLEEHAPGLGASVLHVDVALPVDLERRFGLTEGCLYHLEPALDQQLWLRPSATWHQYGTPIRGLHLCGPGTHPGGGVTGLPGHCAARRLLSSA